jgi:hypothetical protein
VIEIGLWVVGLRRSSNRCLVASAALVTVAFGLINVTNVGADAYAWTFGWLQAAPSAITATMAGLPLPDATPVKIARDPSDLLMLPAVALAVVVGWDKSSRGNDNAAGRRDPAALTWTVFGWATGSRARRS